MATTIWEGTASGDWGDNANWSGSEPVSNDTAILEDSAIDITTGLANAAVDCDDLIIGPTMTGSVGNSPTDPLIIAADRLVVNGGGTKIHLNSGGTNPYDLVDIKRVGAGSGVLSLGDDMGTVLAQRGTITLTDGTITLLKLTPYDLSASSTLLAVDIDTATVTTLYMFGGTLLMSGAGTITNLYLFGGTVTIDAGTLVNLIMSGGTVNYNSDQTITLVRQIGGLFDASSSTSTFTLTDLEVGLGATANLNNGVGNIVPGTTHNHGGTVINAP